MPGMWQSRARPRPGANMRKSSALRPHMTRCRTTALASLKTIIKGYVLAVALLLVLASAAGGAHSAPAPATAMKHSKAASAAAAADAFCRLALHRWLLAIPAAVANSFPHPPATFGKLRCCCCVFELVREGC